MPARPADTDAAMERLLAEEPYLRSLARTLALNPTGDPDDLVQQTWLQALQQDGPVDRPRSWLRRLVHNVASNLRRAERRRQRRECAVALHDAVPSSAELMEREERRRALVAAIDALPPQQRTVVLLRYFEGLPPRRIAADLGVPVTTVWTWLRRGLAALRQKLDAEHGEGRRAFLAPLLAFVRPPAAAPVGLAGPAAVVGTGVIAMTTKTKLVAASAILLALASALAWWPGTPVPAVMPEAGGGKAAERVAGGAETRAAEDAVAGQATGREPVAAPVETAADKGAVLVRVRYGDDAQPAEGVVVELRQPGGEFRVGVPRRRADAAGVVRFAGVTPGRYYLNSDRGGRQVIANVAAGATTEIDYVLKVGVKVTGVVVDGAGVPIAGALVEVAPLARSDFDAQVLATTGADGRFEVRGANRFCLVGARAVGYAAPTLQFISGKEGNSAEVRIVLDAPGGQVEGVVVDAAGAPVRDAVLSIGEGSSAGVIARGNNRTPPLPALVRTDAEGRFRAIGLPPGDQPVAARASGFAPWRGTCHVVAHATRPLRVTLRPGALLAGVVLDAAGQPVRGAEVEIGGWRDFAHYRTRSDAAGGFALEGLPEGEHTVRAEHDDSGKGEVRVRLVAGTPVECKVQLSRGVVLRGKVVDAAGDPMPRVILEFSGRMAGKSWFAHVYSDADGRFEVANCPDSGLSVQARGRAVQTMRREDIDPRAGELVLRMTRTLPPSARIVGRVVDPDGRPIANATISVRAEEAVDSPGLRATGDDGSFDIGPLVPATWRLWVRADGYVPQETERRRLDAGARWELGEVRVRRGGTALFRVKGVTGRVLVRIVDADGEHMGWFGHEEPRRSGFLLPGRYRAQANADGRAAVAVPFSIEAGEETAVDVEMVAGVAQTIEVCAPAGAPAGVTVVRVRRDGVELRWFSLEAKPGASARREVWLAPGDYEVTAVLGTLRARGSLRVKDTPGGVLRLELE